MKVITDLKSWKTSILGIIAGLLIILPEIRNFLDGNPETMLNETVILTGLAMMGIGVSAKDGDKSSKQLGID